MAAFAGLHASVKPVDATGEVSYPLPNPHHGDTAVVLPNGRVLLFGAYWSTAVDELDPTSMTWTARAPMRVNKTGMAAALAGNGRVYVVGGEGTTANEEYDPASDSWAARAPMPGERIYPGVAAGPNGRIYVAGGYSHGGGQLHDTLLEYDPIADHWATRAPMHTPRYDLVLEMGPNGRLYAIGGWPGPGGAASPRVDVEEYDPTSDTWTQRAPLPRGLHGAAATRGGGGLIYVVGGMDMDASLGFLRYDAIADTWQARQPLPVARTQPGVVVTQDDRLLIFGGRWSEQVSTFNVYDLAAGIWSPDGVAPSALGVLPPSPTVGTRQVELTVGAIDINPITEVSGSHDGILWAAWHPYSTRFSWELRPGDGEKIVYVRVRDAHGNISDTRSARIVLDATPPTMERLTVNGGAGTTPSPEVKVEAGGSDGLDPADTLLVSLSNDGAVWGSWMAVTQPIQWHLGERTGPGTLFGRLRDRSGNVSAVRTAQIAVDPSSSPFASVSIDAGAVFARRTAVELAITAPPFVIDMQISNDGGFFAANWEPYASRRIWELARAGASTLPRTVYVRMRTLGGTVHLVSDDIVLDEVGPTGSIARPAGAIGTTVALTAVDDISGLDSVRVGRQPDLTGAAWAPFQATVQVDGAPGDVFAQFRDRAGNLSPTYSTSGAAVSCEPRPPVAVAVTPAGANSLSVIITASGSGNGVRALTMGTGRNGSVEIEGRGVIADRAKISFPERPSQVGLTVRRVAPGHDTVIPLVISDGCGEWPTFVGGGPGGF